MAIDDQFRQAKTARIAVSTAFFVLGVTAGFWFVHIPVVAERLSLDPASLGLVLLCLGIGSLLFQPVSGLLLQKYSSKPAAILSQLLTLILVASAINAESISTLALVLFGTGAMLGATNVSINTQGALVEKRLARPVMSSFHGFFSVGTFTAAGLGGLVISLGFGDGLGAIALALILTPIALLAGARFLSTTSEDKQERDPKRAPSGRWMRTLTLPLFLIMVLAFLGNAAEFSVNDWSALFLHEVKGMSLAWSVSGFAVFSLAMATIRFFGGPIVSKLGVQKTLTLGGGLIATGMSLVVLSPWPPGSVIGFFIMALGLANNSPLLVSQAAKLPGIAPSIGVSAIATGLTSGFLLAPPIIGLVADAFGLPVAFGAIAGIGLVFLTLTRSLSWQD